MRPQPWIRVYLPLAAAALGVCGVFFTVAGTAHLTAIAGVLVLAPLGVAWLGGRATQDVDAAPPLVAVAGVRVRIATGFFILGAAKFVAIGFASSGFVPSLHDEWSYLFGAETIAAGRVANATPPDPEFFDAFHILTRPRWVARYPPGHPALLALGALLGVPWLVPVAASAGTIALVYLLGVAAGGERTGRIAGCLALLAPGLDYLASGYLSQSTFLLAMTGCFVCVISAMKRRRVSLAAVGGLCGGLAILTRPYSAAAIGVPLAVWFTIRCTRPARSADRLSGAEGLKTPLSRNFLAGVLPILGAIVLFAAYNHATTGSLWRSAWQEYNRQYEPDNTLGFADAAASPIPDGLRIRKQQKAATIAREKQEFTWREAIRRAALSPRRLAEMAFPALGFYGLLGFLPFAWRTARRDRPQLRGPRLLLAAVVTSHYIAYSFFYSTWQVYGLETLPFVVVLVACGIDGFLLSARDSDRPMLVLVAPFAAGVVLCLTAFVQFPRFIAQRGADTEEHRAFTAAVRPLAEAGPLLVFVRDQSAELQKYDLIANSPDLAARVVVVLDLGERNAEFAGRFPARRPFLYDRSKGTLTPWQVPPPATPAKLRDRRMPLVANSR